MAIHRLHPAPPTSHRPTVDTPGAMRDSTPAQPLAVRSRGDLLNTPPLSQLVESDFVSLSPPAPVRPPLVVMLTQSPPNTIGQILEEAESFRALGHRVALANVGNTPASLALLPLVQPDLIQIDLKSLRRQPDWQSSQTYNAISAYAEELPAVVLASGIDTEDDRLLAAAIGATLGEGLLFARIDDGREPTGIPFAAEARTLPLSTTPFLVAAATAQVGRASRAQLLTTSRILETCAFDCDEATVVMSTFQKSSNLTDNTVELYSALARNLSYVFAFTHPVEGSDAGLTKIPDLRIHTFARHDPLSLEWNVIILNARYQAMLVARENPASTTDDTQFDFILTHSRPTILQAAQALIPYLRGRHAPQNRSLPDKGSRGGPSDPG